MSADAAEPVGVTDVVTGDGSSGRASSKADSYAQRSNNAIWKLAIVDDETPKERLDAVIDAYAEEVAVEGSIKRALTLVPLKGGLAGCKA